MDRVKEFRQKVFEQVEFFPEKKKESGGQHCGILNVNMVAKHEDLGIEFKCNYFRSQQKNKEFLEGLVKNAIEILVK